MTRRGLLLFAAMSLLWGIPYLFIRIAVSELTPATLVFLRTGIAAVVLLPIALGRGGMIRLQSSGVLWSSSRWSRSALPGLRSPALSSTYRAPWRAC